MTLECVAPRQCFVAALDRAADSAGGQVHPGDMFGDAPRVEEGLALCPLAGDPHFRCLPFLNRDRDVRKMVLPHVGLDTFGSRVDTQPTALPLTCV